MKKSRHCRDEDWSESLHTAVHEENTRLVSKFLDAGADPDELDEWGVGSLHYAVLRGRPDLLQLLIQRGASLRTRDKHEHKTAVQWAAELGAVACLQVLFDAGADLGEQSGDSPLHLAVACRRHDTVRWLLEHGADPNKCNSLSPVHLAAHTGSTTCLELLLMHGGDVEARTKDQNGNQPLHLAAREGRLLAVQLLLRNGAQTLRYNAWGFTALHLAASKGEAHVVEFLTQHMSVHVRSMFNASTPLHLAVLTNSLLTVQVLLCRGARLFDIDNYGNTVLHGAAMCGNLRFLTMTHDKVNVWDFLLGIGTESLLIKASKHNTVNVAEWLLGLGIPCELRDSGGRTPLHHAAGHGHVEMTQFLLDKGASIRSLDLQGKTPLYHAMTRGKLQTTRLLVSRDQSSTPGRLPLLEALMPFVDKAPFMLDHCEQPIHFAAMSGNLQQMLDILNQGVDVDSLNAIGTTPLMVAAARSQVLMVKLLLFRGADPNACQESVDKRTALHLSALCGATTTMQFLINAGAEVDAFTEPIHRTPLFWGVCAGQLNAVKILVKAGAEINLRDSKGLTACDIATLMGDTDIAEYLASVKTARKS